MAIERFSTIESGSEKERRALNLRTLFAAVLCGLSVPACASVQDLPNNESGVEKPASDDQPTIKKKPDNPKPGLPPCDAEEFYEAKIQAMDDPNRKAGEPFTCNNRVYRFQTI